MKALKILAGMYLLVVAASGAAISTVMQVDTTVWFENNGVPEQTTVPFLDCVPGEPTCIGFEGASAGKHLYANQELSIELESQ